MSYCRFQNTLGDLEECLEALQDGETLSDEEARAAKRLIECAKEIAAYDPDDITTDDNTEN